MCYPVRIQKKIAIDNAFVVPNLNVRYHKIDNNKIRSSFPSFKDIELPKLNNSDVTILITSHPQRR